MSRYARPIVLPVFAWLCCASAAAQPAPPAAPPTQPAAAGGFTGELNIQMWDALVGGSGPSAGKGNFVLDLEAVKGVWGRVYGTGFNNGLHFGMVEKGEAADQAIRLRVRMKMGFDQWMRGEWIAMYDIDLRRKAGAAEYEGTFEGIFDGRKVAGKALAVIKPPRPAPAGFVPVQPGEHPRILFRKADVPRLREKLKTPLGKAYVTAAEKTADPINLGVLYQLTGEKKYSDQALAGVQKYIDVTNEFLTEKGAGSGGFGHTLVQAAIAYDLCFDAWPQEFRQQLDERLLTALDTLTTYLCVTSHANNHPCSNYYGPGYGSAGIGTLLYYGDRGPAPEEPKDPSAKPKLFPPAEDYKPPQGVPVETFNVGRMPAKWLWAGSLPVRMRPDQVVNDVGLNVKPGVEVKYSLMAGDDMKTTTVSFKDLPAAAIAENSIDLGKLAEGAGPSTNVFFTVLKVEAEQTVVLAAGRTDAKVILDARPLLETDVVKLLPGLHPMLVVMAVPKSGGMVRPRLVTWEDSELRARHVLSQGLWKADLAEWEQSGKTDMTKLELFNRGWLRLLRHYRTGIGDGGFQAEAGGYSTFACWYPTVYASLYHRMFGRSPSADPDVTHVVPRQFMQTVFYPDGKQQAQWVNSMAGFSPGWAAVAFQIVPDEWKPAVLWAWNHSAGVTDEASIPNVITASRGWGAGVTLPSIFINYPLDMKPVYPSKGMPRCWEAKTFGLYIFRSGWEGKDDFVGQVFLKASPIVGWNKPNAGTFALLGLGHLWNWEPPDPTGARVLENVVMTQDPNSSGASARLTYKDFGKDGTGSVSMDMNDVYAAPGKGGRFDHQFVYTPATEPSPVTGMRAIGFDYSGKCGAPCLMVVADKMDGGSAKTWSWQLPHLDSKTGGANPAVKVEGNTFTISYPDAFLKGTFLSPANVKVENRAENLPEVHKAFSGTLRRITATPASPADGEFLAIITVQKKDAPEVKAAGQGLGAKVTVGGQTVQFDGKKIVFGQ